MPFIDATPERVLFTAIQQRWQQSADPLRGVYLEFAGFYREWRVTATDMQRSLGWVESCARAADAIFRRGARLWAAGNEPAWSFVVRRHSAPALRTPDGVLKLPGAAACRMERSSRGVQPADSSAGSLRVEFTPGLCSDTMAEAAFGHRVVAAVSGALYTGCGLVR